MKTLILAEKPSVAQAFSRALGGKRKDGYFETGEYLITFAVGHLLELYAPEDYNPEWKRWSINELPIIPEKIQYKTNDKTKKQFNIIKKLFKQDIEQVILATDAGREGELIGRLIINHCGWTDYEKVKRFWVSEGPTPQVIKAGLANLKPSSEFDGHYQAGIARQQSDWLFGINLTRFFWKTCNDSFTVGRVQTALLRIICERQRAIENFKAEDYFQMKATFKKEDKRFTALFRTRDGEKIKDKFTQRTFLEPFFETLKELERGVVSRLEKKEEKKNPPKLLNLTGLARAANTRYGYDPAQTLKFAQSLYERHLCLSYPRTPSRVMGEADIQNVTAKLDLMIKNYPGMFEGINRDNLSIKNKNIFDNSELEDHHALIPTAPLPEGVSEEEKNIFNIVLHSFALIFYNSYRYEKTTCEIEVEKMFFVASGIVVLDPGWKSLVKEEKKEGEENKKLPLLEEGEKVKKVGAEIIAKKTKPPAYFNASSLLDVMEHPNKLLGKDTEVKYDQRSGLGTSATRPPLIELLFYRQYVEKKGKKILATAKGIFLLEQLIKSKILDDFTKVENTALWEEQLEAKPDNFLLNSRKLTIEAISDVKTLHFSLFKEKKIFKKDICPACGEPVLYSKKNNSWFCSAYKGGCRFSLYGTFCKAEVTRKDLSLIISGKKTAYKDMVSKKGAQFTARLFYNPKKKEVDLEYKDT